MMQNNRRKNRPLDIGTSDEQRFKMALKNSPIILFEHDRDLRYTWVYNPNPNFGYKADQIIGRTDAELLTPSRARQLTEIKRKVLTSGHGMRREVAVVVNDQPFYFDLTVEPLRDEAGVVVGLACATFDITRRKVLEHSLRETRQRYATAERLARIGHFMRDFETDTAYWSPEIYRIFGLETHMPAPPLDRFLLMVHPQDRDLILEKSRRTRSLGTESIFEYRIRRTNGEERVIRAVLQPVRGSELPSTKITGTLQDITREYNLKQKMAEINHLERESIFRDLHDTVCQELSGIGFLAESARESLPQAPDSALEDVAKIITCAQRAIQQARNIARNLKQLPEDHNILRTSLLELASYIESIYGVSCQVSEDKITEAIDGFVATQLLLIAREAAINAAKHASAQMIRISISVTGHETALRVSDNGNGMVKPLGGSTIGGLAIMRSRADLIGAQLEIGPGDDGGTAIECRWRKGHE